MPLWILRPNEKRPNEGARGKDPWEPWYDKAFGFVVRADTEGAARALLAGEGGDEQRRDINPWTDPELATCERLLEFGDAEVILRDFASA